MEGREGEGKGRGEREGREREGRERGERKRKGRGGEEPPLPLLFGQIEPWLSHAAEDCQTNEESALSRQSSCGG